MSNLANTRAPTPTGAGDQASPSPVAPLPWRRLVTITLGAIALFVGLRSLPTGSDLGHMDFRATGPNVFETCDPSNPQFIPVVSVRSPVAMARVGDAPAEMGREVRVTFSLKTASGKAIAPEDLVVMHTRKLHLLICDPSLEDYQHVHPDAGATPGEWSFSFVPHAAGVYRLFADFTPVATNRALYANADLVVGGESSTASNRAHEILPDSATKLSGALLGARETVANTLVAEREGYRFDLQVARLPVRAREAADLKFSVTRTGGGNVPLQPVMGAYAHLVAFDEARSGFAHLHPLEIALEPAPDAQKPTLDFKVTMPAAGRYVIWSQVNLGGREVFAPFWFEVKE